MSRKSVVEVVPCDTKRLYGPLGDAIAYLSEILGQYPNSDIALEEHWYDYEEMRMQFTFTRPETDEETAARVSAEELQRKIALRQQRAEAQREKDLADLKRLQNKLGIRS